MPAQHRVIAVDGPAGSGKSTFATLLAAELGAQILHTDDLCAGWSGMSEIAGRLVEWVLRPLAESRPPRYRRYDWDNERYDEWHELPRTEALLVEGVMSGSLLAAPYLSMLIWVTAPGPVRLERGVRRDGEGYRERWMKWTTEEDELFARERTAGRADVLVDGAPEHKPEAQTFVMLSRPPSV